MRGKRELGARSWKSEKESNQPSRTLVIEGKTVMVLTFSSTLWINLILITFLLTSVVAGQTVTPTPDEQFRQGVTALKSGRLDEAQQIFEGLLQKGMVAPFLYHNLGIVYQQKNKHQEAVKQFQQAIILDPAFAESRVLLGASLLVLERPKEGITELERAVRVFPDDVRIRQQLARAYEIHGSPFQVVDQYQRISALEPDNSEHAYRLGGAYVEIADWCYRELMRQDLESVRVYQALGQIYMARQDWVSAQGAFEDAIQANPKLPDIHLSLATVLIQQKKFEEALAAIEEELQIVPTNIGAQRVREQLKAQIGENQ